MDVSKRWCVLVPCSKTETWAVPQNCLAEIVTVHTLGSVPPDEVSWRGRSVPILDLGREDGSQWSEPDRGTGLVAIFLGLKGEGCEYWGMAVRGGGLKMVSLSPEEVEDLPEQVAPHATAAFKFDGVVCQIPDLESFQRQSTVKQQVA
ncbi:MAG: chemotaxis protein CheW [Halioglobus sp.]